MKPWKKSFRRGKKGPQPVTLVFGGITALAALYLLLTVWRFSGSASEFESSIQHVRDQVPPQCRRYEVTEFPSLIEIAENKGFIGEQGGEWTACTHLKAYGFTGKELLNFMPNYAKILAFCMQPKTVLEFGCGLGMTADYLSRFVPGGSDVICVEPEPMLEEVFGRRQKPHRPTQLSVNIFGLPSHECVDALRGMEHDLVLSLEVAEHIPAMLHEYMVEFLAKSTKKYLVFSAARPDQYGTGHLYESSLTREEWIQKFKDAGLIYSERWSNILKRSQVGEREYDLMANTIVMLAPGVKDLGQDEYPENYNLISGLRKELTDAEWNELATRTREGQTKALWPELAHWIAKMKEENLCE